MSSLGYAGDLSPREAYDIVCREPEAVLVDCRTAPEWQFVGIPILNESGKEPILIDWQVYPEMAVRRDFVDRIAAAGVPKDASIAVLCRSGVRSVAAARALTAAGYERAYNILDGFEGQLDRQGHRGANNSGWKASGLPWRQ